MQVGIVRLKWEVDLAGYEVVERKERGKTILTHKPAGPYIVPRGGKPKTYDIGLREHDVFLELAKTKMNDEGVLDFTDKWGQLHGAGEMPLSEFFETQASMRWSLMPRSEKTVKKSFKDFRFGSLQIKLEKRGMVLRASRLSQFCWLERFQLLEGGIDASRCANCSIFLPIHREGRPNKYCSNRCRQAMYRKRASAR